mgnify:CR=1 FL=1
MRKMWEISQEEKNGLSLNHEAPSYADARFVLVFWIRLYRSLDSIKKARSAENR